MIVELCLSGGREGVAKRFHNPTMLFVFPDTFQEGLVGGGGGQEEVGGAFLQFAATFPPAPSQKVSEGSFPAKLHPVLQQFAENVWLADNFLPTQGTKKTSFHGKMKVGTFSPSPSLPFIFVIIIGIKLYDQHF